MSNFDEGRPESDSETGSSMSMIIVVKCNVLFNCCYNTNNSRFLHFPTKYLAVSGNAAALTFLQAKPPNWKAGDL